MTAKFDVHINMEVFPCFLAYSAVSHYGLIVCNITFMRDCSRGRFRNSWVGLPRPGHSFREEGHILRMSKNVLRHKFKALLLVNKKLYIRSTLFIQCNT